jgi:hypothetical protein
MHSLSEITSKLLAGEKLNENEINFLEKTCEGSNEPSRLIAAAAFAAHSTTDAAVRRLSEHLNNAHNVCESGLLQELCLLVGRVIRNKNAQFVRCQIFLLRLFESEEASVRCNAVFAFGLSFSDTELSLLTHLRNLSTNDPQQEVRHNAKVVLAKLAPQEPFA